MRLGHDNNVVQVMRTAADLRRSGFRQKVMLRLRKKKERSHRLAEVLRQIASVFGNAHNFVLASFETVPAKMLSDRILSFEKFSRKRFIDHCHVPRIRGVPLRDATSSKDWISDDVEISCGDPIQESAVVVHRSR